MRFRKITAFALSLVLVFGMAPVFPTGMTSQAKTRSAAAGKVKKDADIKDGTSALMTVAEDPIGDEDEQYDARNVRLHNKDNVIPAEYDRQFFHVGDHGFLTFASSLTSVDLPGAPDKARESLVEMQPVDEYADTKITYSVDRPEVLTIDENKHLYRILSGGEATVILQAKVKVPDAKAVAGYVEETWLAKFTFIVMADATGTKLSKDKVTTYIVYDAAAEADVKLVDCPELRYYSFDYTSSNTDMLVQATLDPMEKVIHLKSAVEGVTVVTFILNGYPMMLTLENRTTGINLHEHLMDKGDTVQLELTGFKGKVKWRSEDKKVARVSKNGLVEGVGVGNTLIFAEVGNGGANRRLGCLISVVEKGHTAVVEKAREIGRTCSYSQPMRLMPGFYDCSSLVWMAYNQIGEFFGIRQFAPTAAEECRYCQEHQEVLGEWTREKFENMEYLPGDLLFRVGADNGRYLGIYHVEMFAGYRLLGFDEDGNPQLAMMWANRPDDYYEPCGDVMGRVKNASIVTPPEVVYTPPAEKEKPEKKK